MGECLAALSVRQYYCAEGCGAHEPDGAMTRFRGATESVASHFMVAGFETLPAART